MSLLKKVRVNQEEEDDLSETLSQNQTRILFQCLADENSNVREEG